MTAAERITKLRSRIERGGTDGAIADADQRVLQALDARLSLLEQTYSDHRHEKLLRHAVLMAERLEDGLLAAALTDRDAAERIVRWINETYDNEETNRDYRSALRVYGKRVAQELDDDIPTDGDDIPESLAWVPTSTSSDYDPTPDPRDMLRWQEDVKPMLEATQNARDRAMIALQFDAGLRGGEFKSLCVGDLRRADHGLEVTVDGKQGRRTVLLVPSVPYVSAWLDVHPGGDDDTTPLWSYLDEPGAISEPAVRRVFTAAADRAGIDKPVTPTNFRKSSAAFLASRNLNQAHIEDHHGWVRGSKAAARYIAVFGEDTDRELARLHGVDVSDEEPDPIGPVDCHVCGRANDRDASFCQQCGQALTPESAREAQSAEEELDIALAELPPEKARQVLELADVLEEPAVREAMTSTESGSGPGSSPGHQ